MPEDHNAQLASELAATRRLAGHGRAGATQRAYRADLEALRGYLRRRGQADELPHARPRSSGLTPVGLRTNLPKSDRTAVFEGGE